MRDIFIRQLFGHAQSDPRIILITGDLGFGVFEDFKEALPHQFINAGVAEQNMTGLAAGLALEGKTVFTYSIGNFPTLRCLEQIRNDVLYHQASVNVVAVGGGFSYGALGMSHHATEDIGIMRTLPGIQIFAPCDESETRAAVDQMVAGRMPTYLRLDKSRVTGTDGIPLLPGMLRELMPGKHAAILGYGGSVKEAIGAAKRLEEWGISCAVFSAPTLKPFDKNGLVEISKRFPVLLSVEEHVLYGGLRSLMAEVFIESGAVPRKYAAMCLPDEYSSIVGSQEYLRMRHGLDQESIASRVRELVDL